MTTEQFLDFLEAQLHLVRSRMAEPVELFMHPDRTLGIAELFFANPEQGINTYKGIKVTESALGSVDSVSIVAVMR